MKFEISMNILKKHHKPNVSECKYSEYKKNTVGILKSVENLLMPQDFR